MFFHSLSGYLLSAIRNLRGQLYCIGQRLLDTPIHAAYGWIKI